MDGCCIQRSSGMPGDAGHISGLSSHCWDRVDQFICYTVSNGARSIKSPVCLCCGQVTIYVSWHENVSMSVEVRF